MNWKAHWHVILTVFSKRQDFSRSLAVTYTVNVAVSRKWRQMESLLVTTDH